jgi:hypothetical protein
MKNIHLIETTKESNIYKCRFKGKVIHNKSVDIEHYFENGFDPQFVYITNNDEIYYNSFGTQDIEIGEFLLDTKTNELGKVSHVGSAFDFKGTVQLDGDIDLNINRHWTFNCKKVVLTNNPNLKNVQQLTEEELQLLVDNFSDSVEVDSVYKQQLNCCKEVCEFKQCHSFFECKYVDEDDLSKIYSLVFSPKKEIEK